MAAAGLLTIGPAGMVEPAAGDVNMIPTASTWCSSNDSRRRRNERSSEGREGGIWHVICLKKKKNDCAIKSAYSEKLIAWRKKRECVCLHHRVAVSSLYNQQQQQQESVSE